MSSLTPTLLQRLIEQVKTQKRGAGFREPEGKVTRRQIATAFHAALGRSYDCESVTDTELLTMLDYPHLPDEVFYVTSRYLNDGTYSTTCYATHTGRMYRAVTKYGVRVQFRNLARRRARNVKFLADGMSMPVEAAYAAVKVRQQPQLSTHGRHAASAQPVFEAEAA